MQIKLVLCVCALVLGMGACEMGEGDGATADVSSRPTMVNQNASGTYDVGQSSVPAQAVVPRSAGSGPYGAPGAPPSDAVPCATSWELTFGGPDLDSAGDALELPSGDLVIVGQTYLEPTIGDDGWPEQHPRAFVARVSSVGELKWFSTIGDEYESALAVAQRSDDAIMVAGQTTSADAFIANVTTDGAVLWSQVFGGDQYEIVNDAIVTPDSGTLAAGCSLTLGGSTPVAWVFRTDAQGTLLWEHTLGDETGGDLYSAIEVHRGGGFVVSGYVYRQEPQWAANTLVARFDDAGALAWQKEFGGVCFSSAYETIELVSGGFAVAGFTCEGGGMHYDPFLMVLTPDGEFVSKRIYEEPGAQFARSLIEDAGGFTVVLLTDAPGGRLMHTDFQGTMLWEEVYATAPSRITRSADGGLILTGRNDALQDVWAAKFAPPKDVCAQ